MKFFTPELYLRYNSPDDAEADHADEDWERAILDYKSHLSELSEAMNYRVKALAETSSLHDAELLSLREDAPKSPLPLLFPIPVATISLKTDESITSLVYMLGGEVGHSSPPEGWPFSPLRTHWLYDEVDLEEHWPYRCWHRILLSDGRVISIPFFDVIVQTIPVRNPESPMISPSRSFSPPPGNRHIDLSD